ncbi:MAG: zeta toxin family protein [Nitrospiraceae bacterium]|nr:MAG: zeta toxin family protein [Nitrospiraceae bacterium]
MKGDSIVVEEHHIRAAQGAVKIMLPEIIKNKGKYTISVAGESGSGKSEIATAIANELKTKGMTSVIFQQDDYFIYPPRTNDAVRRKDITWVGPQEVKLDLLDQHLRDFLDGKDRVTKPLVCYEEDCVEDDTIQLAHAEIAIADGTYTTLLQNVNARIFIDRDYRDTRKHREKRIRHASELDPYIDKVLEIEHGIISRHKAKAFIIVNKDYESSLQKD